MGSVLDHIRGPEAVSSPALRLGAERVLDDAPASLSCARLGLLVNQASLLRDFEPTASAFARRFSLSALFSPQHGLFGEKQDNMVESDHERCPRTGLPVFSLYGEQRAPTDSMLEQIDVLAVDLQDVGCRVYTFAWTLTHCLDRCARRGVPVVVLDRPNPVGEGVAEGAPLQAGFESFVGRGPLPMRHGGTMGDIARWWVRTQGLDVDLQVVACSGSSADGWLATGQPWVPPSPNLPRLEGADVYCGQVLWEGTNLSEGRGTTTPFELCGAPFIDPERWVGEVALDPETDGVRLRPVRFEPTFHKWSGERCGGVWLHVLDRHRYQPLRTTLRLMAAAWKLWPEHCAFASPPYEYEEHLPPIDCIAGGPQLREWVQQGDPHDMNGLAALCEPGESPFKAI